MIQFLVSVGGVYAVTFLLTMSHAFGRLRAVVGRFFDKTFGMDRYNFETCRMCVGLWVTLGFALIDLRFDGYYLGVYGFSYFLATQERE